MAKFALIMPPKDFSLKDYFLNNLNTGEVLTSMTEAIRRRLREDSFSRRIFAVEPMERTIGVDWSIREEGGALLS